MITTLSRRDFTCSRSRASRRCSLVLARGKLSRRSCRARVVLLDELDVHANTQVCTMTSVLHAMVEMISVRRLTALFCLSVVRIISRRSDRFAPRRSCRSIAACVVARYRRRIEYYNVSRTALPFVDETEEGGGGGGNCAMGLQFSPVQVYPKVRVENSVARLLR